MINDIPLGIGATFFAKIWKIKINNFMIFRKRMMNDIIGNAWNNSLVSFFSTTPSSKIPMEDWAFSEELEGANH